MRRLAALSLAPLLLAAAPGQAGMMYPPVADQVVLELRAEAWAEASEAKVTMAVHAVLSGQDAAEVRADMLEALDQVAPGAEWRFLSFDRAQDQSGLERWDATVEARLAETALGGLADRAADVSRPGLQIDLADIAFTPTLAEVEAVRADLRAEIYRRAGAEIDRLNQAFPDREFRLGMVDFLGFTYGVPAGMPAESRVATVQGSFAAEPLTVAQRVEIQARVTLSAFAELPDETDDDDRR